MTTAWFTRINGVKLARLVRGIGHTLFAYIFLDLLKVFLLASTALAGIMSFGGLLRPLTQYGLGGEQVLLLLGYFMPAMTNYSWPVAGLFAAVFVYGRLAADNELVACRAAGVSWRSILAPAFLLGLVVAFLSFVFLCYVVPRAFLKAERVVKGNIAQLIATQIERQQRVQFQADAKRVIFARDAEVLPSADGDNRRQTVRLRDVSIVSYEPRSADAAGNGNVSVDEPLVPQDFFVAATADATVEMPPADDPAGDVRLTVSLVDGAKVPAASAESRGASFAGAVGRQVFGPYPLPSPVRETTRFMDVDRLRALRGRPELSRAVERVLRGLVRLRQEELFALAVHEKLRDTRVASFPAPDGTSGGWRLTIPGAVPEVRKNRLELRATAAGPVRLERVAADGTPQQQLDAGRVTVRGEAVTGQNRVRVAFDVSDATLTVPAAEGEEPSPPTAIDGREERALTPMPPEVAEAERVSLARYLHGKYLSGEQRQRLLREVTRQTNAVESELHNRVAFALSCLVLVLVGATLGMLTRSGNFVTAFAVSIVPALACVVLIVTGQHAAESLPRDFGAGGSLAGNPLGMGLAILWSGVLVVAAVGVGLFVRLRRN